jgi:hypothetical protein
MITDIPTEQVPEAVGKYFISRRNGKREVAKVTWVNVDEKQMGYEMVSGQDKGARFKATFHTGKTIKLYDEDSLILALLET